MRTRIDSMQQYGHMKCGCDCGCGGRIEAIRPANVDGRSADVCVRAHAIAYPIHLCVKLND